MGFSAGGHLAASASNLFDDPAGRTGAATDTTSARPDFQILIYPVITMTAPQTHAGSVQYLLGQTPSQATRESMSMQNRVSATTSPAFLVHGSNDASVPVENSVHYYSALKRPACRPKSTCTRTALTASVRGPGFGRFPTGRSGARNGCDPAGSCGRIDPQHGHNSRPLSASANVRHHPDPQRRRRGGRGCARRPRALRRGRHCRRHSTDGSAERLRAAGLTVIEDDGRGKGDALRLGIQAATGDIIVTMDADGSHDPAEIASLVAPVKAGDFDLVIGCRMRGGSDEFAGTWTMFIRLWGNNFLTQVINTRHGVSLTDTQNGFRAFRAEPFKRLGLTEDLHTIELEMVLPCLEAAPACGAGALPRVCEACRAVELVGRPSDTGVLLLSTSPYLVIGLDGRTTASRIDLVEVGERRLEVFTKDGVVLKPCPEWQRAPMPQDQLVIKSARLEGLHHVTPIGSRILQIPLAYLRFMMIRSGRSHLMSAMVLTAFTFMASFMAGT